MSHSVSKGRLKMWRRKHSNRSRFSDKRSPGRKMRTINMSSPHDNLVEDELNAYVNQTLEELVRIAQYTPIDDSFDYMLTDVPIVIDDISDVIQYLLIFVGDYGLELNHYNADDNLLSLSKIGHPVDHSHDEGMDEVIHSSNPNRQTLTVDQYVEFTVKQIVIDASSHEPGEVFYHYVAITPRGIDIEILLNRVVSRLSLEGIESYIVSGQSKLIEAYGIGTQEDPATS